MKRERFWDLQTQLKRTVREFFQDSWEEDKREDIALVAEISASADREENEAFEIIKFAFDEEVVKIYATVHGHFTSFAEIQELVHHVLSSVGEDFLILVHLQDVDTLRFWFMTGTLSHGHQGEIIFKREDLPDIGLELFD